MIERALPTDLDDLVALMRQFYAEGGLPFRSETARSAMAGLLETPEYGAVWVLRDGPAAVGYLALCVGYSLEMGGRDAFIDEVFVERPYRNQNWGKQMIEAAIATARASGVQAVHLTVDHGNRAALTLYESMGFKRRGDAMLTCRLDPEY